MIKEQSNSYIDSDITDVFHFLELKGQHNFLIGSNSIRNMLYTNDYDLN
jgi:Na+-transporting NADH:ubiquinone oxidoreductase subunit NqrF